MQTRRRALPGTQTVQRLDLGLPVSRALRRYSSVFKPPADGILL